jgi:hypothetical protein
MVPSDPASGPDRSAFAAKFRGSYANGVARCAGKTTTVAKLAVTISFTVESSGRAHHDLEWLAPSVNHDFELCMDKLAESWTFSRAPGSDIAVEVPLEVAAVRDVPLVKKPTDPPKVEPRGPIGNGVIDPFKTKDHHAK